MEIVVLVLMFLVMFMTWLKLSFLKAWHIAVISAVCSLFIVLTWRIAIEQSRNEISEWLGNQIIKGEHDAFYAAKDFGKYPVMERTEPYGCCDWCAGLRGVHLDPGPHSELWMRHDNCRGSVSVSGYRSANGELDAYGHSWRKKGR